MKKLFVLTLGLLLISGIALAVAWEDCPSKGLFPYFHSGGDWYTILVFVNGSEETSDVVHVRFWDAHG